MRFLRDQTKAIRIIAWMPCAKPLFCGFCACVTGRGVNNNNNYYCSLAAAASKQQPTIQPCGTDIRMPGMKEAAVP